MRTVYMKFVVYSVPAWLLLLAAGFFAMIPQGAESCIGVAYGTQGNNLPRPRDVVNLYKSHGIPRMRIYKPDPNILNALKGSNIQLVMGAFDDNNVLSYLNNPDVAGDWVYKNIMSYSGVSFRYIVVGNEVIPGDKAQYVLPVMRYIQNALNAAGLNQIKVTTSVSYGTVNGYPPSAGTFTPPEMTPIVQYLDSIGSPLLVNIYPYFSYTENRAQISLDYALFRSPGTVVHDPGSNLNYQNLFDAMVDTVLFAMDKVAPDSSTFLNTMSNKDVMVNASLINGRRPHRVVPSETGWPSGGCCRRRLLQQDPGIAQIYNQNLINHVKKGTPKNPGEEVETYIFSMFNENQKPGKEIERHFGLFYPNQQPVYPISFN